VVILIADVNDFAVPDAERQPPVSRDVQAPVTFSVATLVRLPKREALNFSGSGVSWRNVSMARNFSAASGGSPFALSNR